jgi:NO-binding membrane sensor protein with MHYT domain
MFQVFTCLTVEHDWRLVVLACTVCFLASAVAISLFHRAQASTGRRRFVWLGMDAAAAGFGIWATHFIALLAYDPGVGASYNLALTVLSLLIAALITGAGLALALRDFPRWTTVFGGAIVGAGIIAMHYTGMLALELPGRVTWAPNLVVASVALGIAFGGLAILFAARRDDWTNTLIAAVAYARDRRYPLHGHGRRDIRTRSDARGRRGFFVANVSFPCRRSSSSDHSWHVSRCGIERCPIGEQATPAKASARHRPAEYVAGALHVRC